MGERRPYKAEANRFRGFKSLSGYQEGCIMKVFDKLKRVIFSRKRHIKRIECQDCGAVISSTFSSPARCSDCFQEIGGQ